MTQTLTERARSWLAAAFPERQIYIRSDGRVQFFTFSSLSQAVLAGMGLLVLSWVAFASVTVVFKNHIIVAKNHRFQQMQANYEARITDLQLSYDELNGALVAAEDRFKSVADGVVRKQQVLASLLGRKELVIPASISSLGTMPVTSFQAPGTGLARGADTGDSSSPFEGHLDLQIMPGPVAPQPTVANPTRASFLEGPFETVAGAANALLRRALPARPSFAKLDATNSELRGVNEQIRRIERLNSSELQFAKAVDVQISTRIGGADNVMRRVGLNPGRIAGAATGGPTLPMNETSLSGLDDTEFSNVYASATAHQKELGTLLAALRHVPLTTPVHGSNFGLTSDFGPRVDPFTHQVGFHPGLDFAGPWGSTVTATAPGTVVYAGPRGGYGNMVEIDHGYGLHTRYGHLSSLLVRVGGRIEKGTPVGKLGSTGRSTGPHVHYEVWLADAVRDPSRFIEAGRHVQ
ncbi:MAG: M23 family metallopeptidase [Alphaproteobacteria bacterium]|nr:M23 family metallopeptidase [Alphaproteobacteria bacterium]